MTNITTQQIEARLRNTFTNVSPLHRINAAIVDNAPDQRVSSHIPFMGLTLVVGCYAIDATEESEYNRFLYIPETSDMFHF